MLFDSVIRLSEEEVVTATLLSVGALEVTRRSVHLFKEWGGGGNIIIVRNGLSAVVPWISRWQSRESGEPGKSGYMYKNAD